MAPLKVGLVGAAGETGASIVNGLLAAGGFEIVALTRPASVSKPANLTLKSRGCELRPLDLKADHATIVSALKDIEVLISAISAVEQLEQIPLAKAAKSAGVKRFIPCGFITVIPVGGIHLLRDQKEIVYQEAKKLGLPYTIVDVGWWYQISFPSLPSGKIDYAVVLPNQKIAGDGNQLSALTDLRDIGHYIAKVIVDERTLNRSVLVYNELWSQNQILDLLEKLSGEKLPRSYASRKELEAEIAEGQRKLTTEPTNTALLFQVIENQYVISWGIRGDNTPEYARYLGYVTSDELYPDFQRKGLEEYLRDEVLEGKARRVHEEVRKQLAQMQGKK